MEIIIGQEAITPDGLGRVSKVSPTATNGIPHWVQVQTYFEDRSCQWDPKNIELIDPRRGQKKPMTQAELQEWAMLKPFGL